ncbi:hypothetical protein AcV5_004092 [Taiwanofungus camphoratus]|nr:hypothetical protein AcV5_004092 [Antrodia cinnamomea]
MLSGDSHGRTLKRADPTTIQNKFMVGYQGWFTCAGDGPPLGPGHHGWLHWFNYPMPDGGRPNTDLWPDVSEYSPSELYPAPGLKHASGEQAFLFSSRHPKTVQRHFHWMAQHGVDGAFLQRFAGQTDLEAGNEGIRNQRDEIGDRVREAAEKEGRVFAIMYDVSGVAPDRIQRVIEHDWMHLVHNKGVLDSPNYLHENGKPVITFWGFGFADSRHDPATVRAITAFIRNNTPGGAYIMAGTPAHWRTSVSDADTNPEFVNVWLEEFDAISPWTIGRYHNSETADRFEQEKIKGDLELINKRNQLWEQNKHQMRRIDYIPVIFPGGSGHNLSEGKWGWNDAPRQGGHFMWRQLFNVRRNGVRIIYGAMWDEYDEGTAYLPVVTSKRQVPVNDKYKFMALDEDGFDLPSDWYMRICGFTAESLRGERIVHETFPVKELQDYWSTRPRYEDKIEASEKASGTGDGKWQSYEEWQRAGTSRKGTNEVPPPPYSLEASASGPIASSSRQSEPQHPPPAPWSTRPMQPPVVARPASRTSSVSSSSDSSVSSCDQGPSHPISSDSVNALADDLNRQSMISPSRSEFHPMHPGYPAAQRPYSPYGTQSFPQPDRSSVIVPGSVSSPPWVPPVDYSSSPGPGPWTQAPWAANSEHYPPQRQPYSSYPGQGYMSEQVSPATNQGYAPGYLPSPPPPLRPRPSAPGEIPFSHPQSLQHRVESSASPSQFPQAYSSASSGDSYGNNGQQEASYGNDISGPGPVAPRFDSQRPFSYCPPSPSIPNYGNPGLPPPPVPPRPYASHGGSFPPPPPPPRPNTNPYLSGPPSSGNPSSPSNPFGYAINRVGTAASQAPAQLQSLAHAGTKFWNKHKK